MRITLLCAAHSLGDERVVARQAMSLAEAGHEVLVLGRGDPDKRLPQHPNLVLHSIEPLLRGDSLAARASRLRVLCKLYRAALASRPDIIAAHEPDSALVGLLVRRRLGTPIHFDIHECFEEMAAARSPRVLARGVKSVMWAAMRFLARRADWLTVVSPVTARQYQALRPDGRVSVIHNSPPIELFPACNQDQPRPLFLCHEGWLDRSRGMTQLLEALALARSTEDLRLLVVGKLRSGCESEFNETVKRLRLSDIVQVTGWIPYKEVGQMDAKAQIGLVTMQPTGNNLGSLSNKVYSYMACGQAVIVPAGSASEELVRKYDCGIAVDTTRPADIAAAIVRLSRDADLRKALGRNGRRAIETDLGWHRMEDQLRQIYQTLGQPSEGAGAGDRQPQARDSRKNASSFE